MTTLELLDEIIAAHDDAEKLVALRQKILRRIAPPRKYGEALVDAIIAKAQEIDEEDPFDLPRQSERVKRLNREYYHLKKWLLRCVGEKQPAQHSQRKSA